MFRKFVNLLTKFGSSGVCLPFLIILHFEKEGSENGLNKSYFIMHDDIVFKLCLFNCFHFHKLKKL